jgi:RNA polymerase sigma factor (sigma-70 family)
LDARGGALPADEFRGMSQADGLRPAALRAVVPAAEPSDRELLDRSRLGDRAAFGRLVERHHRAVGAILRQRAGPTAPLEDLVQEVFARALAHLDGFRNDAAFLTWATSIGLHLATDWRRKDERRRRLAPPADVESDAVPCERRLDGARVAEERDEMRRARAALDGLPDAVRAAITLRVVEEMSYEEVAARLAVPVPRARQWVCRGLKRLREQLEVRRERT